MHSVTWHVNKPATHTPNKGYVSHSYTATSAHTYGGLPSVRVTILIGSAARLATGPVSSTTRQACSKRVHWRPLQPSEADARRHTGPCCMLHSPDRGDRGGRAGGGRW